MIQWHEFRKRNNLKHLSENEKWRCFKIYEAEYYHARKTLVPVAPGSGQTPAVIPVLPPVITSELNYVTNPYEGYGMPNRRNTIYQIVATNEPTSYNASILGDTTLPPFLHIDTETGTLYSDQGSEEHDPNTDPDDYDLMNLMDWNVLNTVYEIEITATNSAGSDTKLLTMLYDGSSYISYLNDNLTEPMGWNATVWYHSYIYSDYFAIDATGTNRLYRFCTNDPDVVISQELACTNLLNPTQKITPMNNCTWDYVNGFTGNGVDMYLNTHFNHSSPGTGAISQNNVGIFVKLGTRTNTSSGIFGNRVTGATPKNTLLRQINGTSMQAMMNATSSFASATVSAAVTSGDYLLNRRASGVNGLQLFQNSTQRLSALSTSVTPANQELYVLAINTDGSPAEFSGENIKALKIGNSAMIKNMILSF